MNSLEYKKTQNTIGKKHKTPGSDIRYKIYRSKLNFILRLAKSNYFAEQLNMKKNDGHF